MEAKLKMANVHKTYRQAFGKVNIFQNLNFNVSPGEFVTICGESGCGKSTLLLMIAGLEVFDSGIITIDGNPVRYKTTPDIGFVFQEPALLPWRTVWRNVAYGLENRKVPADERAKTIKEMLKLVGLLENKDSYPFQLSGGMRQRVSIARALAVKPSLLLMDEPFSALDVSTRRKMRDELTRIWKETGITILFVTHDIEEACELATKTIVFYLSKESNQKQVQIIEDVKKKNRYQLTQSIIKLIQGTEEKKLIQ